MKTAIIFSLFLLFYFASDGQEIFISTNRLGDLKINMSIDSINKYIDTKTKLSKISNENNYRSDTIDVMYKKRYSVVNLHDNDSGNQLYFYFLDNKLYAMESKVAEDGGE